MPSSSPLLPSHHINVPSSSTPGGVLAGGGGGRRVSSNTSRKLRSRRGWLVLACCALLFVGYQGLSRSSASGGSTHDDDDEWASSLSKGARVVMGGGVAGKAAGKAVGVVAGAASNSRRPRGGAQAALGRLFGGGSSNDNDDDDDDGSSRSERTATGSGVHLLTEFEDELIAEDDRYYDSLPESPEHHHGRGGKSRDDSGASSAVMVGVGEDDEEDEDADAATTAALPQFHSLIPLDDRLGSDADPALSEQARHRLIGVEQLTRHSALRALSHYLYEGGELPRRWLDNDVDSVHGQTPLDKVKERVWKHASGDGMEEQLLEVIQSGDQDLGEDTFEEGWKAFADERLKVVIFSKSYCPFSRKAKAIFNKYEIHPRPFIVELDQRADGPVIQALLHSFTGRRTVPNILVNFAPLGGSDEVTLLEAEGSLRKRLVEAGLTVDN